MGLTIENYITIGLAASTGISGYFIIRYQTKLNVESDKRKRAEELISEHKRELYARILNYFFSIITDQKKGVSTSIKDKGEEIIQIKRDAMIYAPNNIVLKIVKWQEVSNHDSTAGFNEYLDLVKLIRTDLGYPDDLKDYDLIGLIMNDPADKKAFIALLHNAR